MSSLAGADCGEGAVIFRFTGIGRPPGDDRFLARV
jgi:hypothetical protein